MTPTHPAPTAGRLVAILLAAAGLAAAGAADDAAPAAGSAPPTTPVREFLEERGIARADREPLAASGGWTDTKQAVLIRVLARLTAPAPLTLAWWESAPPLDPAAGVPPITDDLVRVTGRATFVAPQTLSPDLAVLAGTDRYDLVRIVVAGGTPVDVACPNAPRAWPRGQPIDEPASTVALPLAAGGGPETGPAAGSPSAGGEPAPPAALLLAATRVAWTPPTPLGRLGVDCGLLDAVNDGPKGAGARLEASDTEAFFAVLAAVGGEAAEIERAAGPPADVVPIIDPTRRWFDTHRGDPLCVAGIARRATRIAIDDPARRRQVGADHYWELYVFVPTPLLQVNGRLQEDYPVVCCVRDLPAGMPSGERIGERVRVAGFALKRYSYPLQDLRISSSQGDERRTGERMATVLLVGDRPVWLPEPTEARTTDTLFWVFAAIMGLIGLVLAWSALSWRRSAAARRDRLPDRIDL